MHPFLTLRLAFRGLRRDVPTSGAVILILALGLAAPAVFFSLLWGGGMRPLPVPAGEEVVRVDLVQPRNDGRALSPLLDEVRALREAGALAGVEAFTTVPMTLASEATGAVQVGGAVVTPGTFPLLRVAPILGRIPGASEAAGAVILGHDLWMELYGGTASALGAPLSLNGAPGRVVAVMPPGFAFPFNQSAWSLLGPTDGDTAVELVGRLAGTREPGVAAGRLEQAWRAGDAARAAERTGATVRVRGFTRGRGESGEAIAFGGLVLVGLCLLLIAAANAASLLLVRAMERVRVLGVQSALGAGRGHLAAQLVAEALLLASAGGVAGLVLAGFAVDYIQRSMGPENFGYWWMRMAVDGPVILFTGALVLGTAVAAGSLPIARVLGPDLQRALKDGHRSAGAGPFRGWSWGRVFVTGQLALSCGALVAAGLTGRAMHTARSFGGALPTDRILIANVGLDVPALPDTETRVTALEELGQAVAALPGISGAAMALGAPGYGEIYTPLELPGVPEAGLPERRGVMANAVSPSYFALFGLDPIRGRLTEARDGPDADPVAVVSEGFVRRFLGEVDPLDIRIQLDALHAERTFRIVGVVPDLDLAGGPRALNDRVYLPLAQVDPEAAMVLVDAGRAAAETGAASTLRSALAAWNAGVPIRDLRTLADAHDFMTRASSNLSLLAVGGGLAGLVVAAIGLYALLAFRVRRARRELGVRLALGADASRLARAVVADALGQLLPALGVGLILAWTAAPLLGVFLLGGDPRSPAVFGVVALAFLASGLSAALVPALRARAVEPAQVLRGE
ncbi:MAG TPA: ABC transporter permease [Longimicrobiales bacterium]|nr:ABC transporter permease [Longimicrobiales bacterium]